MIMHTDISYQQHLDWLNRTRDMAIAEVQGFLEANIFPSPRAWSSNERIQKRYEIGFMDGKAKLLVEEVRPCGPTPEQTTSI